MAYNLELFELFIVSIPRARRVVGYVLGVSLLAGLVTHGALLASGDLTGVAALTGLAWLGGIEVPTVLVLVAAFALAALAGGEATQLLVTAYPRRWGHFLALVCLVLAGTLLPVAILFGGAAESPAAVWFALGVAFLFSMQVLVISDDIVGIHRQVPASAVQPAVLFGGLTVATPLSASLSTHAPYIAVLGVVALALVLVSAFAEWLMRANVSEVRAFEITSHLSQREPLHLGMGGKLSVPVQTFAIEGDGRTRIAAPWVHPGILEGIGGGRLTPSTLAGLNDTRGEDTDEGDTHEGNSHREDTDGEDTHEGNIHGAYTDGGGDPADSEGDTGRATTDERGFFWHVPSTHLSDSPDPHVHEPVLAAIGDPETTGEASQLVSRTYDGTTFHGRRYGEKRVVFFESDDYADIEVGVFGDVIDPERTLVVDRHARVEETGRREVYTESADAETLRGYLRDFLDVLDEQPLGEYRAGDALELDIDGISLFALVEEVDGQRTACVVADRNERPYALADARERLHEYDEVLLFTTDTHASITENRFDPQTSPERICELVASAAGSVTDAAAGLTANRAEVELLRSDYSRLLFSLNILARVYIASLAALYVLLGAGLWLV